MHIFLPEYVWCLYRIDYMALSLKIIGHNTAQNFVSMYLPRQLNLELHGTMSGQVFGDQGLKTKKLCTYAEKYDSKEFKMYHWVCSTSIG